MMPRSRCRCKRGASGRIWRPWIGRFGLGDRSIAGRWGRCRRGGGRDPRHPRYKTIAAAGDRLDAAALAAAVIEDPAKGGDLHVQIVVLDHGRRPDRGDNLVARDHIPRPLDQHPEDIECARAGRDRHENTALVAPEQTAAAPVEAETLEQKNVSGGKRVHKAAPYARQIFRRFAHNLEFFIAAS